MRQQRRRSYADVAVVLTMVTALLGWMAVQALPDPPASP